MQKSDNFYKYQKLRKQYKKFTFDSFEYKHSDNSIDFAFNFSLDNIHFRPSYYHAKSHVLKNVHLPTEKLSGLIFNIGMIELVSYWKIACPKTVVIKPFALNEEQKAWWKNIYFKGLGEFFYLNSIQASQDDFMTIATESEEIFDKRKFELDESNLIPVGGGKDSAVTIELLSGSQEKNLLLMLNPRKACIDTALIAGYPEERMLIIHRRLDPVLLKLNDEGYLNGHTPFSALLAFVSLFAAAIAGKRNIILSNESSANESTVDGSSVNHQYSKSYEFEKDFRGYVNAYISEDFNYFSFLRPINELQIARLFSRDAKYFSVFRSCNTGSKTDSWCGLCPKCLFTAIILSPFLDTTELNNIFGKDMLDDSSLLYYFKQLYGEEETKPFECVGTIDDVNAALLLTIKKREGSLPFLLVEYIKSSAFKKYSELDTAFMLRQFDKEHFLENHFEQILRPSIND